MSLTFPTGPTNGQQTTTAGRTYQWNGQAWTLVGSGIAGPTGPAGPSGSGSTNVVTTPAVLSPGATVTGYDPGAGDIYRLAVTGTTGTQLQGLGITGEAGSAKLLINVGATAAITLNHATGPNANAQFSVPWGGDYVIDRNGGAALVVYDATSQVWRVV
jgi:hypothetical protein